MVSLTVSFPQSMEAFQGLNLCPINRGMPQSEPPSFHVRLTPALMKRIKIAAVENERSINAEISARLDRSFDLGDDDRAKAVKLLAETLALLDKGRRPK